MPLARSCARLLVVVVIGAGTLAVAGGRPAVADRSAADARAAATALQGRERAALYALYASEAALVRARARAAAAQARSAELARREAELAAEISVARRGVAVSRLRLAERLTAIYKADRVDPVAVLLTSASLDEAVENADALRRLARGDEDVLAQVTAARDRLDTGLRRLRETRAEADAERAALTGELRTLVSTRAAKADVVAGLRRQRRSLGREIDRLDALARAAARRSHAVEQQAAAAASATENPSPTPASGGTPDQPDTAGTAPRGSMTVETTAYGLTGRTATGLPTGPGICAVDPNVIPLGTRFDVPGYGTCLAADTGGAVVGAMVDLWMPLDRAAAWGRRTVTVTFR